MGTPTEQIEAWIAEFGNARDALNVALARLDANPDGETWQTAMVLLTGEYEINGVAAQFYALEKSVDDLTRQLATARDKTLADAANALRVEFGEGLPVGIVERLRRTEAQPDAGAEIERLKEGAFRLEEIQSAGLVDVTGPLRVNAESLRAARKRFEAEQQD